MSATELAAVAAVLRRTPNLNLLIFGLTHANREALAVEQKDDVGCAERWRWFGVGRVGKERRVWMKKMLRKKKKIERFGLWVKKMKDEEEEECEEEEDERRRGRRTQNK